MDDRLDLKEFEGLLEQAGIRDVREDGAEEDEEKGIKKVRCIVCVYRGRSIGLLRCLKTEGYLNDLHIYIRRLLSRAVLNTNSNKEQKALQTGTTPLQVLR